jgi:hypothetical protein
MQTVIRQAGGWVQFCLKQLRTFKLFQIFKSEIKKLRTNSGWCLLKGFPMVPLSCRSNLAGRHTVKSSNFVILLSENIFFRQTFLRLPNIFLQYWSLYSNGLGTGQRYFGLGHCLDLENSFFCRVTKLGDRLLISSPSTVTNVTLTTVDRGC